MPIHVTIRTVRYATMLIALFSAARGYSASGVVPIALQFSGTLRPPNLEYWKSLRTPTIDNYGEVAFRALVDAENRDGGINSAYRTSDNQFIARAGEQAPGLDDGIRFQSLTNLQISPQGRAGFVGYVEPEPAKQRTGIWAENSDGSLRLVAIAGSHPPGVPDGVTLANLNDPVADNSTYYRLPPFTINGHGEVAFIGRLDWPNSAQTSFGLWSEGGGRGLRSVAYTGMEVPQVRPGATIWDFETREFVPMNSQGVVAFVADLNVPGIQGADSQVLFVDHPDQGLLVAGRRGEPAPGLGPDVRFSSFSSPRLNNAGQIVFMATHTGGALGNSYQQGIWSGTPSNFQLLARPGDLAPGVDGFFTEFPSLTQNAPVINGGGHIAFAARIAGPGIDASNDSGIWAQDEDGQLQLIVREGQLGGGEDQPHDFLAWDDRIYFNNRNQLAFAGRNGAWATDVEGNIHQLIDSSDLLPFHHGITPVPHDDPVRYLQYGPSTGNEDGLGTSFNDRGEFVFYAYSKRNNMGIFASRVVAVPELRTVSMICVGMLVFGLNRLQRQQQSNWE